MGTGKTYDDGNPLFANASDVPKELDKPIVDMEVCRQFISSQPNGDITDMNEFRACLYNESNYEEQMCEGDSGGPAYILQDGEQTVVGIASAITAGNCSSPLAAAVYMDVFKLDNWIRETTGIA